MNTKRDELIWLRDVLSDLERNYPDHNKGVLGEQVAILSCKIKAIDSNKKEQ